MSPILNALNFHETFVILSLWVQENILKVIASVKKIYNQTQFLMHFNLVLVLLHQISFSRSDYRRYDLDDDQKITKPYSVLFNFGKPIQNDEIREIINERNFIQFAILNILSDCALLTFKFFSSPGSASFRTHSTPHIGSLSPPLSVD